MTASSIKELGLAAALALGAALTATYSSAEEGRAIPAPTLDEPAGAGLETITLAGGCFWGVQGVFQHVAGVAAAVSGYEGGEQRTASYQQVSGGDTGHAESVRVTFDPKKVSLGHILQVYFSVAHDPTELNRQGPDHGTQYRSAIFPTTPEQAKVAKAYVAQLSAARAFDAAIVTTIEQGRAFYPAEAYHQDFLTQNPTYPYIATNDLPKVAALKRLMPDLYRAKPVLVASAAGD
ncbi:peptide-methionine (S)-S-oxide reductase MsrA [Hansschlegelia quercus]|uniref:Peptide methionine sulfoxide reductase MsrA n=1 Tax=Hansschlegelia quercus TaxID=2528245 RepID=A0A4Q9GFJ4_9HYPH|nr:peptide-methionine (S)-S-oxide reductase MsrA [Hansschlegelia quercus]TBN51737.1 peptide-methionine (S)-S-oxide reductase [Hansschlegelia quercus]